jgi:hypothetical protein
MLKPKFINIVLYLFIKYIVFALILAFQDERFKSVVINNAENAHDLFVNSLNYLVYVLIFIFVLMLIFSIPIYFSFKIKNAIYFLLSISIILVSENFAYTYLASPADLINGVYNGFLSIIFLLLLFYKHIKTMFNSKSHSQ